MFSKKIVLVSSIVAMLSLPFLASANLRTCNYTKSPSTVKITSGLLKKCSSDFIGGVTQPIPLGSTNCAEKPVTLVKAVCGSMGGTCTADVYASANCTGTKVASVAIDLGNLAVTVKPGTVNPNYTVVPVGSTVTITQIH